MYYDPTFQPIVYNASPITGPTTKNKTGQPIADH